MKKFADWSKAPEWAKYHTVDKSGVGCWWETLPSPEYAEWYTKASKPDVSGTFDLGSVAWDDTLEARPTEVESSDLAPGGGGGGGQYCGISTGGGGGYKGRNAPEVDPSADYASLRSVLKLAYEQSAKGKGKERHANDRPFNAQPIMQISRMVGLGFPTGQVQKKVQEAGGMVAAGRPEAAQAELLGAIVYCAAAWLLIEEGK